MWLYKLSQASFPTEQLWSEQSFRLPQCIPRIPFPAPGVCVPRLVNTRCGDASGSGWESGVFSHGALECISPALSRSDVLPLPFETWLLLFPFLYTVPSMVTTLESYFYVLM
jgi:hypothetical protein